MSKRYKTNFVDGKAHSNSRNKFQDIKQYVTKDLSIGKELSSTLTVIEELIDTSLHLSLLYINIMKMNLV